MTQVRFAWICWLIAAMLFFSGAKATGWLIVLCVVAGFGFSLLAILKSLKAILFPKTLL